MNNEKIEKLEEKIKKLKAQKQSLVARKKEKERKERTRRLIQVGALVEKYLDLHTPEETEIWLKEYLKNSNI